MSKTIKSILFLAVFGVIGYIIYVLYKKNKNKDGDGLDIALAPPPKAETPQTSAIQNVDSGLGKAAIERRISEILNSDISQKIQNEIQQNSDILNGVSDDSVRYYNQNISRPPILSAKKVPLNLSENQKTALSNFAGIDTEQGNDTLQNLREANQFLKDSIKTCFVGEPELASFTDFKKQLVCQNNQNCGKKYKDIESPVLTKLGAKKVALDMAKIAKNWNDYARVFDSKVKEQAISDLRNAGWKFIGFDF